ncbi:MAG: murein biosynthesis integral membrane protein MurJ [Phycisphaerae bacterium]|jgi:putative peptidoglycan lipid II flippase
MSEQRSVVGSAKLIAICTLLSRITGLVRDVLLAQAFGLRWVQDAFVYAFQIPNLFRRLLGEGAMAAVFVPSFTQCLERDGHEPAWRLLARTLALLSVTLTVIVLVIEAVILLVWILGPDDPEQAAARRLLLSLTALMLPFMLTICVVALLSAILNCVGSFVPAALAPILLNIAMIAAIAGVGPGLYPAQPAKQVYVIAVSVVVAGVLQILFLRPVLRSCGVKLGWRWEPSDPAVKRMLRLLVPVALGQGVLAFGVYLDAQICILLTHEAGAPERIGWLGGAVAYPLEEGALSAVTYAQRLYQFPLGVLVISLATAAMPAFSRQAARGNWPAWSAEVRRTLRLAIFEGLLTGAVMMILAEPIIRLLFEYRRFTPAHTARAAYVLIFYGVAMWAYCAQHIVLRGYYSLGDVWTPLKISAAVLPLNVVLTLTMVWFDGIREAAFAISSAITFSLSVVVGLVLLRRRAPVKLLDRSTLAALTRMLIAAGVTVAALAALRPVVAPLVSAIPWTLPSRAVETLGLLSVGSGVYLLAAKLLGLEEIGLLLGRMRERIRGGRGDSGGD